MFKCVNYPHQEETRVSEYKAVLLLKIKFLTFFSTLPIDTQELSKSASFVNFLQKTERKSPRYEEENSPLIY